MPKSANRKAKENLRQIIKATGAELRSDGNVELKIGRSVYTICSGCIYRRTYFGTTATCLQMKVFMPDDERIASVILLLLNNPKLFSRWKKKKGWHA